MGFGNPPSGGNNTMLIVGVLGVGVVMCSSSAVLLWAYMNGYIGGGGGGGQSAAITATLSPVNTGSSSNAASGAIGSTGGTNTTTGFSGLSTQCAMSENKNQTDNSTPPFDANRCQGLTLEANCQQWTSVQQSANNWVWTPSGSLDGCVPVSSGADTKHTYHTVHGSVDVSGIGIRQSGGRAQSKAGAGYGKGGNWRNSNDSNTIVDKAAQGALPTTGRRTTIAPKTKALPAPYQPAFAAHAPYTPGIVSYSAL